MEANLFSISIDPQLFIGQCMHKFIKAFLFLFLFHVNLFAATTSDSWTTYEDADRVYLKFKTQIIDSFVLALSKTAIDSQRYRIEINAPCRIGSEVDVFLTTIKVPETPLKAECIDSSKKSKMLISDRNSIDYILGGLSQSKSITLNFNSDGGKRKAIVVNKENFDQKIEEVFDLYDLHTLWLKCEIEIFGKKSTLIYGFNLDDQKNIQSTIPDGAWVFSKSTPRRIENWLITEDAIGKYFRKTTLTFKNKAQYDFKLSVNYNSQPNDNDFYINGTCNRYW